MFVIDASVILAWCLDDEASDAAEAMVDRLLSEGGIAPAHWPLEVANGFRMAERRQRLDGSALDALATRLGALPVDIIPVELRAALASIEIARSRDLTVYDASYLSLASTRGLGLATVDLRLAEACQGSGISLVA